MSDFPIVIPDTASDADVTECIKTWRRFSKAQRLADILDGEGVTVEQSAHLDDEAWDLVMKCAQVDRASIVTKLLTLELLRDREEKKRG